jgi:hypothetical protein
MAISKRQSTIPMLLCFFYFFFKKYGGSFYYVGGLKFRLNLESCAQMCVYAVTLRAVGK